MAMRGGRGGRGGWRGGRSGGRGGMLAPGLKDDEGNLVPTEANSGPPPLFPPLTLESAPPDPSAQEVLIQMIREDLLRAYKESPYFTEGPEGAAAAAGQQRGGGGGGAGGGADDVERYSDRFARKAKVAKEPLASLLTLHPHHFPEELFSDRDKRLAARGPRDAAALFKRVPADGTAEALNKRLDGLSRREDAEGAAAAAGGQGGGAPGRQGAAGEAGEGDDDDVALGAEEEDDDDVMEEDDYYQGEYYDDDEGYDDLGDDGGDEGAVY